MINNFFWKPWGLMGKSFNTYRTPSFTLINAYFINSISLGSIFHQHVALIHKSLNLGQQTLSPTTSSLFSSTVPWGEIDFDANPCFFIHTKIYTYILRHKSSHIYRQAVTSTPTSIFTSQYKHTLNGRRTWYHRDSICKEHVASDFYIISIYFV